MLIHKRVKIAVILFCCLPFRPCLAQQSTAFQGYFGAHQMDLKWSIAGNQKGTDPNVLSELIWENLSGPMVGFRIEQQLNPSFTAKVDFNFAAITAGLATDADYAADNRKENFYHQLFNADKGAAISLKATIAYQLLTIKRIKLSPFIGFDFRNQQVALFDREPSSTKGYLNSKYQNVWQGGISGVNTCLITNKFILNLSLSASYLSYNAKANWNLIAQLAQPISFKHQTNAVALNGDFDVKYAINKNFSTKIGIAYGYAKAFKGVDEAFYVSKPPVQTQLNEVKTASRQIGIGFNYLF